ncbi:DUF4087 domain-containing protein [Paraburkholderia caballeronis]|uniref:DUF4087 domain-containing protein n=1 Tax=Paraburkholderia caballeronis TaxID=416943 RepID=UPI0010662999|nr:DUF4087 domain-containing protein [Paraburkholderia caballeronis]TDV16301.1 antitoxin component YwqK of YwqJK toxin-antitoxin module [Paraburkholderia caballeronis]TDV20651.1 antitoxin component YwqK of YwqJK toxin-antitoxin module [Paraburkholderia caballeronis]TDV33119.1 antitoxin component YwqK of YwqJK toxin-antitoxin module [Paraburkholderia caballeronis]
MKYSTTRTAAVLSSVITSILLSACGEKVLDYRNADLVNGAFYAKGSNDPFSGKVTNVPSPLVFNDPVFKDFASKASNMYIEAARMASSTGGASYDRITNVAASALLNTGLFPSYTEENAAVFCDIRVNNGKLTGNISCSHTGNDGVVLEANIGDGTYDGSVAAYLYDSGKQYPFVTASFKNGKLDGEEKVYSPATHQLVASVSFDNGIPNGTLEYHDENNGGKLLEQTFRDGKLDGMLKRWSPGGSQLIYQASLAQGQHEGDEETFDPSTGKKTGQAHWTAGKVEGEARQWDAQGNLIAIRTWRNGLLVTSSSQTDILPSYATPLDYQARSQDPNHPATLAPLPGPTAASPSSSVNASQDLAAQIHEIEQSASASSAPQTAQPTAANVPDGNASRPDRTGNDSLTTASLPADGPATNRCGWIDNDMPSSLGLQDRDGVWNIVGGQATDDPAGFESNMPPTEKGRSCGCLKVETNRHAMQIIRILSGSLKPVSACQNDRNLNSAALSR